MLPKDSIPVVSTTVGFSSKFRVRFEQRGGHVHCRLFSAPSVGSTYAKCGDFCVTADEFPALMMSMPLVEFKHEGEQ